MDIIYTCDSVRLAEPVTVVLDQDERGDGSHPYQRDYHQHGVADAAGVGDAQPR